MRHVRILVPEEQREPVTAALADEGFDVVQQRAWHDGEAMCLVEFPAPTDAIGYVRDRLAEAGVDEDQYTTVTSLESARAPGVESLQERFSADFDPLRRPELRSKARDIARDPRSFNAMVFLSAIIAVAGLLVESAAVVVGSMVIAPLVGPVLTTAVGAVTGDREMLVTSVWLQGGGLLVATVGAFAFCLSLQWLGVFPANLDVTANDLIALRLSPSFVTVAVGLAAGAAGAFGLMTKGPTSLVGVMIAAALVPAAGTVGIAAAWAQYRIAIGAALVLVLSLVLINVGAAVTLRWYYRPRKDEWLSTPDAPSRHRALLLTAIAVAVVLVVVGAASIQQIAVERTVTAEVEGAIANTDAAEDLRFVSARMEYAGGVLESRPTVTVLISRPADAGPTSGIADELDRRITAAIDREVSVRVQFSEYTASDGGDRASVRSIRPGVWLHIDIALISILY